MPKSIIGIAIFLLGGFFVVAAYGQSAGGPSAIEELPCSSCHTCEKPAPRYLCLRTCPRTSAEAIVREMSHRNVPGVVLLDKLQDLFLPVPFDHKGHADMADMMDGCAVCHHYTPEGAAHPACKSCHEVSPQREDMRKPSLKAAYHRQCMSCHREWSGETECAACHPPKVGTDQEVPTTGSLLSRMHPPIPEPHTEIYEPASKPIPGTKIIFRHKEHIDRFGLKCANCHRENSCNRCHKQADPSEQQPKTFAEHHQPCSNCHDVKNKDACDHCHWKEGDAKPKPFDHVTTGWPLNRHHAALACRTCHETIPFQKRDRNCEACHGDWAPDSFDHAVTGQVLDKNHAEVDCGDCHTQRKFDVPPTCEECHDKDEGPAFPTNRPGPVVIPSHRESDSPSGE